VRISPGVRIRAGYKSARGLVLSRWCRVMPYSLVGS
jgi:hypothetical protein